jgi:Zn-dependent membrane protease YugP
LTIPTKKEELEDIVKIFCELAVFLKLFTGCYYKFYFTDTKNSKQKTFSSTENSNLLSYIPTVLNTSYILVGYPLIMGRLSKKLNELSKRKFGQDKFDKLLNYCKKIANGNVYFVNLGPISCYIDPKMIKKNGIEKLKKEADPERLRTMTDWILKAYNDNKHLIFYSDLDSPVALAHEFGHYLESIDGTLGKIQRNDRRGIFSSGFVAFLAFILGLFGSVGEIIGTVSGMLLKSPVLLTEYMASYKGLKLMEESKIFTEEEIKHTKKYFKTAWNTYLTTSYGTAATSSIGRLIGTAYRFNKN